MAQTASTTAVGNAANQNLLTRTEPVVIDIRWIIDKARLSTESIVRVIAHYGDMLAGAESTAVLNYLNLMAAPILHNLQRELQSLQRQMATYADVMNPVSVEYHTIQANAAVRNRALKLQRNRVHTSPQRS